MDKFAYVLNIFTLQLSERTVRLDVAKYSFSDRIANEQNILGERIIENNSLSDFKRKSDRHPREVNSSSPYFVNEMPFY